MRRWNRALAAASCACASGRPVEAVLGAVGDGGGVTMLNCRACVAELVECARARSSPGAQLQGHLRACPSCRERWDGERALTVQFRKMRDIAWARRQSDAHRERIMREFEQAPLRAVHPWLRWALGTAAVVLIAIVVGQVWRDRRQAASPAKNLIAGTSMTIPAGAVDVGEIVDENDFVEVPYAPPLATGELVSVVRTELRPAALARMGINIDNAVSDEILADVLLGEDGFPRGVR